MKNLLKEKLQQGEKGFGTFCQLGGTQSVEAVCHGGVDFIIVDTEHGPFEVKEAMSMIYVAKYHRVTPLVRVKDGQRNSILRMLDGGAHGLIIPNIHSLAEAAEIVRYGKYQPLGERGVAGAGGCSFWQEDYAQGPLEQTFSHSNSETLLIPQCETRGCLEDIENIVALAGVDGIFVGPFDLSTALGLPGQTDAPQVVEAFRRVAAACRAAKKFSFIYCGSVQMAKKAYKDYGFDAVAYGADSYILVEAYKSAFQQARG